MNRLRLPNPISLMILLVCAAGFCNFSLGQSVKALHSFNGSGNSQYPDIVTPVQGRDGQLYGTTTGLNFGSAFRVTLARAESDLFAFDNTDGYSPYAGLTLGTDGSLYGTTSFGGSAGNGVLFKISPSGEYSVLHEFTGGTDGLYPRAAPVEAADGNLYGTSGTGANFLGATVYRYGPGGKFSTIYQFSNATDYGIIAPLTQGSDGNLYGTAYYGSNNCGSLFKLSIQGILLTEYKFPCGAGGANPAAPLMQATDGNFYGTTESAANPGEGTVFQMNRRGTVKILHTFTVSKVEGQFPDGGLVQATDGKLYGSTSRGGSEGFGTLYQISTGGEYQQLYSFSQNLGQNPYGGLLQHTNGLLYGTARGGGAYGYGSVYSLDMALKSFITFVLPEARTGRAAQILGQGLTGATSVTFNGVAATKITVRSDTFMTAVVPDGATTGSVVVKTPTGTLTSNVNFRVLK